MRDRSSYVVPTGASIIIIRHIGIISVLSDPSPNVGFIPSRAACGLHVAVGVGAEFVAPTATTSVREYCTENFKKYAKFEFKRILGDLQRVKSEKGFAFCKPLSSLKPMF